jgi:hypothetical protein
MKKQQMLHLSALETKSMRHSLFLLAFLIGTTVPAQQYRPLPDHQLSKIIVDAVLNRDQPYNPFMIYTPNSKAGIDYIIRYHPSPFWETVITNFHVSENRVIRYLLANSYSIDSSLNYRAKINFIKRKYSGIGIRGDQSWRSGRLIDQLFILFDKNRGICLVYFHAVSAGNRLGILKRINGVWKVKSFEEVSLE